MRLAVQVSKASSNGFIYVDMFCMSIDYEFVHTLPRSETSIENESETTAQIINLSTLKSAHVVVE